jgi:hypothetical protein
MARADRGTGRRAYNGRRWAGVDRMTVKNLGRWSSVAVAEKHYTGEIKPVLERAMDQMARAQGVA